MLILKFLLVAGGLGLIAWGIAPVIVDLVRRARWRGGEAAERPEPRRGAPPLGWPGLLSRS